MAGSDSPRGYADFCHIDSNKTTPTLYGIMPGINKIEQFRGVRRAKNGNYCSCPLITCRLMINQYLLLNSLYQVLKASINRATFAFEFPLYTLSPFSSCINLFFNNIITTL
jgi:hypothetical protein